MIPSLSGSYIDETYGRLVQVSGSEFADGFGTAITFGQTPTGSLLTTASVSTNTITFTKGNGDQFAITVVTGSSTNVDLSGYATTSSFNQFTSSVNQSIQNINSATASFVTNDITSSFVLNGVTSSMLQPYVLSTQTGSMTMQNLTITGTASINYLSVTYETASVIYSSGSNQFGDATNDTQTLIGTVIVSGSQRITGSLNVLNGVTASLQGTASWATNATTATNASNAIITDNTGSNNPFFITFVGSNAGSRALNVDSQTLTYTPSTNTLTAANFAGTASWATNATNSLTASFAPNYVLNSQTGSFATTGSNVFRGNQTITGSFTQSGSNATFAGNVGIGTTNPVSKLHVSGTVSITGEWNGDTNYTRGLHFSFRNNDYGAIYAIQNGTAWRPLAIDSSEVIINGNSGGTIKMPYLTNATQTNVVGVDTTSGQLYYQEAPTTLAAANIDEINAGIGTNTVTPENQEQSKYSTHNIFNFLNFT